MPRQDPPPPGNKPRSRTAGPRSTSHQERPRGGSHQERPRGGSHHERPRGGPARPIHELMPEIGRSAFRKYGFVQSSVVTRWGEIVGAAHARVSAPETIRFPPGERCDGILQLVVEPAHAPLISAILPEVIERVNRFFGYNAVAKVKIRQGRVQRPDDRPPAGAAPVLKPIPVELGDSLRDIGDPELRAVLESLARSITAREEDQTRP